MRLKGDLEGPDILGKYYIKTSTYTHFYQEINNYTRDIQVDKMFVRDDPMFEWDNANWQKDSQCLDTQKM